MKQEERIRVLVVEPDKEPYTKTIDNKLEEMQAIVGGWIETYPLAEGVDIICNEEGKINGLPLNRPIYHNGKIVEIIAGTFFIAGADLPSGEFISLTDEEVARYTGQFLIPVTFARVGGEIVAVPSADESYISAEEFGKYLAVQRSGVTNMFDLVVVQDLTGLSREKVIYIMRNYESLLDAYCS